MLHGKGSKKTKKMASVAGDDNTTESTPSRAEFKNAFMGGRPPGPAEPAGSRSVHRTIGHSDRVQHHFSLERVGRDIGRGTTKRLPAVAGASPGSTKSPKNLTLASRKSQPKKSFVSLSGKLPLLVSRPPEMLPLVVETTIAPSGVPVDRPTFHTLSVSLPISLPTTESHTLTDRVGSNRSTDSPLSSPGSATDNALPSPGTTPITTPIAPSMSSWSKARLLGTSLTEAQLDDSTSDPKFAPIMANFGWTSGNEGSSTQVSSPTGSSDERSVPVKSPSPSPPGSPRLCPPSPQLKSPVLDPPLPPGFSLAGGP